MKRHGQLVHLPGDFVQPHQTARRSAGDVVAQKAHPAHLDPHDGRASGMEVQAEGVETVGGYAKEVSAEYLQKQKELISKHIAEADIVITTALVIGKKAPVLVTEEMVKSMKPGSVIVDMAVESGGNCSLSEFNTTVVKHGVTIIGQANLPSMVAVNASELYAVNISTLLLHLANKDSFKWEMEEDITKRSLITHQGNIVHQFTQELLNKINL